MFPRVWKLHVKCWGVFFFLSIIGVILPNLHGSPDCGRDASGDVPNGLWVSLLWLHSFLEVFGWKWLNERSYCLLKLHSWNSSLTFSVRAVTFSSFSQLFSRSIKQWGGPGRRLSIQSPALCRFKLYALGLFLASAVKKHLQASEM